MRAGGAVAAVGVALLLILGAGCQKATPALAKSSPAATVSGAVKENQLNQVEFSEAAERRLGIETTTVSAKTLALHRVYPGELMLPVGASVIVSAPVAGTLQSPESGPVPRPGQLVTFQQPILNLIPLLSPAERIALATQRAEAEGQVQQATTQREANQIAFDRAERLVKESVGSARMADEAKAQLQLSQKQLDAAVSRKKILDQTLQSSESSGGQPSIVLAAPQDGLLRACFVMPGEVVASGATLFEVIATETLWLRVPVYTGELAQLRTNQPVEISDLVSRPGEASVPAEPIAAPPTATPLSSTIDLYYQVKNEKGTLRPGQRMSVLMPLVGDAEERVVPWSAVVQDIHGGAWVYEKIGDHKYARRRIQVKKVVDSWAVLEQGPPVGTPIISTGVAEVFGSEFWKQ